MAAFYWGPSADVHIDALLLPVLARPVVASCTASSRSSGDQQLCAASDLERSGRSCLNLALSALHHAIRAALVPPLVPEQHILSTASDRALGAVVPSAVMLEDPAYFEVMTSMHKGADGNSLHARQDAARRYTEIKYPASTRLDSKSRKQHRGGTANTGDSGTKVRNARSSADVIEKGGLGEIDDHIHVGPALDRPGAAYASTLRWETQHRIASYQRQQRVEHMLSLMARERRAEVTREERMRAALAQYTSSEDRLARATTDVPPGTSAPPAQACSPANGEIRRALARVDAASSAQFVTTLLREHGVGGVATAAAPRSEAMPAAAYTALSVQQQRPRLRPRPRGRPRRHARGTNAARASSGNRLAAASILWEQEVLAVARCRYEASDGLMRIAELYGLVGASDVAAYLQATADDSHRLVNAWSTPHASSAHPPVNTALRQMTRIANTASTASSDTQHRHNHGAQSTNVRSGGSMHRSALPDASQAAALPDTRERHHHPCRILSRRANSRRTTSGAPHGRSADTAVVGDTTLQTAHVQSPPIPQATWSTGRVLLPEDVPGRDVRTRRVRSIAGAVRTVMQQGATHPPSLTHIYPTVPNATRSTRRSSAPASTGSRFRQLWGSRRGGQLYSLRCLQSLDPQQSCFLQT